MNLGFLTSCIEGSLSEKIETAKKLGFQSLEVTIGQNNEDISLNKISKHDLNTIKAKLLNNQLTISSLAYYQNLLTDDLKLRRQHLINLKQIIKTAYFLKVPYISTFLGRDPSFSIKDNFQLLKTEIQPIIDFAETLNIKIAIENCPMPSWDKNGFPATISYSPELWSEMFRVIPNQNFGLNFDASHLIWQQIDYLKALNDYFDRIFNIHLKDVSVQKENLKRYGIFGKQIERNHPYDFGWYQPILLGEGDIDWIEIIKTLKERGYNQSLTIEFKDDRFITKHDVINGLKTSKKYIETIERKLNL